MQSEVLVAGQAVPVAWRRSRRARRLLLRVDLQSGGVEVVLPMRTSLANGRTFLDDHRDWIAERLAALPPRIVFADGTVIPILGVEHRLRHRPDRTGGVWREDGELHVSGLPEHLPRRVRDWLRRLAREEIGERACTAARRLGRRIRRLTIRDTTSRWGSCSASGALSFSWRLVLAPEAVVDYVVAHEVAHLVELNHSARFWAVVTDLMPNAAEARDWLRTHGAALHRCG